MTRSKNVFHIAEEETYQDGQVIFKEGSSGDWVYFIVSGSVEIYKNVEDKKFTITKLEAGEVFGELGFIGGIKRTATAQAIGETTLGLIDREFLDREFNQISGQLRSIIEIITVRFKQMLERACDFTRRGEPRVPKALSLVFKDRQAVVQAYSANMSTSGLFIKTESPLKPGSIFPLQLQLPGVKDPLQIKGEVIWARRRDASRPDRPAGMGVKFREISKRDHQLLKDCLTSGKNVDKTLKLHKI